MKKYFIQHFFKIISVSIVSAYAVFLFNNTSFAQIAPPAGTRTDYAVGGNPGGIAFDNVTNSVWVANWSSDTISKVDIHTGARIDYPAGFYPISVAFDSITNSIWIANVGSGTVSKVNIVTGARIDYSVGSGPVSVSFDNVTNSIWVTNFSSNTLSKVNIYTGTKTDYPVGLAPRAVVFDNVTNSVWVTNTLSGTISKVNVQNGEKIDYPVGGIPWGIAFDSVTNSVWVTNANLDTISKVNVQNGEKIDYPVGGVHIDAVFDNVTNSIWSTNWNLGTVSKVDVYTGARIDYSVGHSPQGVAFDNITNSVWVANVYSKTVSKIAIGNTWQLPRFFSQVKNASNSWKLRKTPGTKIIGTQTDKPSSDVIKTVPNDWVLKVATTTDSAGKPFEIDDYRWYGVIDETDEAIGWMAAKDLITGTEHLSYDASTQASLGAKASSTLYTTKETRIPVILQAVDTYYTQSNSLNSLYGGGGGAGGTNNFQSFIQGSTFPKELVLAIISQESGSESESAGFNNEIVTFDYGHGIMQATFVASSTNMLKNDWDNRGVGSDVTIPLCKSIFSNDYKKCYANSETPNNLRKPYKHYDNNIANPIYKQYANTFQSIYSNIKDGFRVIQDKYRPKCGQGKPDIVISGYVFNCQDIERMLNVWGYNGFGKDRNTGLYTGKYLKDVAGKLENISSYFPGITYADATFIQKMKVADAHKQVIRVYSPVTFSVVDSVGRITGLVNDLLFEDIPNSLYERNSEGAVIFFPSGIYRYRVVGTETGTYKFFVDDTNDDTLRTFRAIDIPITSGEVHEYIIDWDMLDRGGRGVTLNIDTNGDGVIDRMVQSDGTLTEIVPPSIVIGSPVGDYLLNATATIQFSATDASGIEAINVTLNGVSVSNNQVVSFIKPAENTLEVSAMDTEGNISTATATFDVLYTVNGFLQPVRSDGSSVYNQGMTLPVRFVARDVNSKVVPSVSAKLYVAKVNNGVIGNDEIPASTTVSSTGNQFRYDAGGHMYMFNLSTEAMSPGVWQIKAVLDSGQEIKANVQIKSK